MNNIKVTILIPTYNNEKTITRCIDHLVNQTYNQKLISIIVLNDGSKDKTYNIVSSYAKKYKNIFLYSQKNKGLENSRKRLISLAKTPYVMWCDGDDYYHKKAIAMLIKHSDNGSADIVVGKAKRFGAVPLFMQNYFTTNRLNKNKDVFFIKNVPYVWGKLYRTSLCKPIFKKLNEKIAYAEDYVFNSLLWEKIKIFKICPYNVYYYNTNNQSGMSGSVKSIAWVLSDLFSFNQYLKLKVDGKKSNIYTYKFLIDIIFNACFRMRNMDNKQKDKVINAFRKAVKEHDLYDWLSHIHLDRPRWLLYHLNPKIRMLFKKIFK